MITDEPLVEPLAVADIRSGPKCWRFGFATKDPRGIPEREKRRRELVFHVVEWLDGVDVVDEWSGRGSWWVVLETPAPVSVEAARSFAEEFPHYLRGSFAVDRSA